MDGYRDEEAQLGPEELRDQRIEFYAQRERYYALVAAIFTAAVFIFGASGSEAMRVWLSGLAGGLFLTAGFNRLLGNMALARRS